jgi:hypothetical protein
VWLGAARSALAMGVGRRYILGVPPKRGVALNRKLPGKRANSAPARRLGLESRLGCGNGVVKRGGELENESVADLAAVLFPEAHRNPRLKDANF